MQPARLQKATVVSKLILSMHSEYISEFSRFRISSSPPCDLCADMLWVCCLCRCQRALHHEAVLLAATTADSTPQQQEPVLPAAITAYLLLFCTRMVCDTASMLQLLVLASSHSSAQSQRTARAVSGVAQCLSTAAFAAAADGWQDILHDTA
jgi:hypothetical protein